VSKVKDLKRQNKHEGKRYKGRQERRFPNTKRVPGGKKGGTRLKSWRRKRRSKQSGENQTNENQKPPV